MPLSPANITNYLEKRGKKPLHAREIADGLRIPASKRKHFYRFLTDLASSGKLTHLKGDRYALPEKPVLIIGSVSVHRDGYGFVRPDQGDSPDVFIPARFMREVMDGDQVVVRIESAGRFDKPEGRIVRVEKRAHTDIVGRYEDVGGVRYVLPSDLRVSQRIFVRLGAGLLASYNFV